MDIYAQILSGAFVIGLLAGTVWLLRRGSALRLRLPSRKHGGAKVLESFERLPLTPQHSLHLVRAGGRGVLVAVHSQGCVLLESRPWDEFSPDSNPCGGEGGGR